MSDQGQWFKLWIGADDDPDLGNLSNEDFGRWCKLGLYVKKHGSYGTIKIPQPALPLQNRFRVCTFNDVVNVLERFPNLTVSPETILTVTFKNWHRFQGDFSTPRIRKMREMKRSKRREEKRRGEEKNIHPPSPPQGGDVLVSDKPSKNDKGQTEIQRVVLAYKLKIGVEGDGGWDKLNYRRFAGSAKRLLIFFDNDSDRVIDCIDELGSYFTKSSLDWTLETIVKRAADWKYKRIGV